MAHDGMWLSGLLCVFILWGCEERKPAEGPRPPQQQALSPVTTPSPPLPREARAPDLPVDAGTEAPDAGTAESIGIPGAVLSQDRRFAFVVPPGDRVRTIDLYDASNRRKMARITVDKSIVVRSSSARVRWTAGNNLLLTWSAGTNVASGIVYGLDGKPLFEVSGSGMSLSPSMRYVVTFPTLFADAPIIEVYDFSSGRKVAQKEANADTSWVLDDFLWQERQLVVRVRDSAQNRQEFRIDLDAPP